MRKQNEEVANLESETEAKEIKRRSIQDKKGVATKENTEEEEKENLGTPAPKTDATAAKEDKKEKKTKPLKKRSKERRIVDLTQGSKSTTITIPINLFQIFVMVLLAFAVMVVVQL